MAVAPGIETTLRTLLRSQNPAATDLLVVALGSDSAALRVGAVRAIALREDATGHQGLIKRLEQLPADAQSALSDVGRRTPLTDSLGKWIGSASPRLAKRAATIAVTCKSTSLLPEVVAATQMADDKLAPEFAKEAFVLATQLDQDLRDHDPRVARGADRAEFDDPAFARRAAVNALAAALETYGKHHRRELIDALLLLTPSDEPALLRVLRTPDHDAHDSLLLALRTSRSRGALGVLAGALADTRSPQFLVDLAAERHDRESLELLMELVGSPIGARVRESCKRVASFAWTDPSRVAVLAELSGTAQSTAIQLAAASKSSRRALAVAIELLIAQGADEGRLAACRAIDHLPSHLAIQPLSRALEVDDPTLAAETARLLRKKDYPQATATLVGLLEHADPSVRKAAQGSLKELSFTVFRDHLDDLDPAQRQAVGKMVGKADPLAVASLRAELTTAAVSRRLRAFDLIETMGLAGELTDELIAAVSDRDAGVRGEAVRLLASGEMTPAIVEALRTALDDSSAEVRVAAETRLLQEDCRALVDRVSELATEEWG